MFLAAQKVVNFEIFRSFFVLCLLIHAAYFRFRPLIRTRSTRDANSVDLEVLLTRLLILYYGLLLSKRGGLRDEAFCLAAHHVSS